MKKTIRIALFAALAVLIAVLMVACDLGGKPDQPSGTSPQVVGFTVLRAASDYTEEGQIPCVTASGRNMEKVIATVELTNPSEYTVASVVIDGTEYRSGDFRTNTPTRVSVEIQPLLPQRDEYEPEITSYEFKLDRVTYRNGSKSLNVSKMGATSATVRVNPTFTVTLDLSQTGKKKDENGNIAPETVEVGFQQYLSLYSEVQMNPSLGDQSDDVDLENWDQYGRIGYGFLGWYTQPDGGELVESGTYTRFSDLTLYARYEPLFQYDVETDEQGDDYAVITGLSDTARNRTLLLIPAYIDGYPIRKLGDASFKKAINTTTLLFYAPIVSIGAQAFQGLSKLSNLEFPETLLSIGDYAFDACTSLQGGLRGFSFKNVREIGAYAFRSCNWNVYFSAMRFANTLYIPSTVETIGEGAFSNCGFETVLISENFAPSVNALGVRLFQNNANLASIHFDLSDETPQLRTYTGNTQFRRIPDYCFYNCTNLTFYNNTLPEGVQTIGAYAFTGGGGLKRVTSFVLPDSVQVIGEEAFTSANIETLSIGENSQLRTLGNYAFNATKLTEVHIKSPNLYTYGASPFYNTQVGEIFVYAQTVPTFQDRSAAQGLPSSVKYFVPAASLENYRANWYLEGWFGTQQNLRIYPLEDVYQDNQGHRYALDFITDDTARLTHLFSRDTDVVVPNKIDIGEGSERKSVTVTAVAEYFTWNTVKSVDLPSTVTEIGANAFASCTSLSTVKIDGKSNSANQWDNIEVIGDYAFYFTAIRRFTSGKNLRSVGKYAFYICTKLTEVTLHNGMGTEGYSTDADDGLKIGLGAFQDCSAVTTVTVGKVVSHLDVFAFRNNSALETVYMERNSVPKVITDSYIPRVFDYEDSATARFIIYVPSQAAMTAFQNQDGSRADYANWKNYRYAVKSASVG